MPHFFSIDLGTSNCAIMHLGVGDVDDLLMPKAEQERRMISVPFYYEITEDVKDGKPVDSSDETDKWLKYYARAYFDRYNRLHGIHVPRPDGLSDEQLMMPSVVYRYSALYADAPVYLVGQPAVNMYERNHCQGELYENTKTLMDKHVLYEGITAVDIARMLLRTCFKSIKRYLDKAVNPNRNNPEGYAGVAISYPASRNQKIYLDQLKKAAKDAAVEAGLIADGSSDDFYITTQEPYAALLNLVFAQCVSARAAIAHGEDPVGVPGDKTVMVVDLGGGTSDICMSIIRHGSDPCHLPTYPESTERGDSSVRCAVNLAGDFGGADIDKLLSIKLTERVYAAKERSYDPSKNNVPEVVKGQALMYARRMKHFFSDHPEERVYEQAAPGFMGGLDEIVLNVKRNEYDAWIAPYIESQIMPLEGDGLLYKRMPDQPASTCSIRAMIENTLRQSTGGTDWSKIDVLYLTGGTSRMPEVQQLMRNMIRGTECELIISGKCFRDIAAGALIYGALNSPVAMTVDVGLMQYTPAPRSSVALMCDGAAGKPPHILIGHSEALDGVERTVKNAFVTTNTERMWIQLYTGISYLHPNYSSLQMMEIDLKGQVTVGTPLDLVYKIDQNMQTVLKVGCESVNGRYELIPVKSINMDGAVVVYDEEEAPVIDETARCGNAVQRKPSNRLLTTVSTEQEARNLLDKAWRNIERLQNGLRDGMMAAYGVYSDLKRIALEHLDVLCYAVMLNAPTGKNLNGTVRDTYENVLPALIVEAVRGCNDEELRSFSRTLYRMLNCWPCGSYRWSQAVDLIARVMESVKLHGDYRDRIIGEYHYNMIEAPEGWATGVSFAYVQLLRRALNYVEEARIIFDHVFEFFVKYGGYGRRGISLDSQRLGGEPSTLVQVFNALPEGVKQEIVGIRDGKLQQLQQDGSHLKKLAWLIKTDPYEEAMKWLNELDEKISAGDETGAWEFFMARIRDADQARKIRWREGSLRVIGWLGEVLRRADELGLDDNSCQEALIGLIFALDEMGEKREKALEGLNGIPDGGSNLVRRLHHLIGKMLVAKNTADADFNGALDAMINAHAEMAERGMFDKKQTDYCWQRVLKKKFVNEPLREHMAGKLAAAGTTDLNAVVSVLQLFQRTYCTGTMDNELVRRHAVPHEALARYIRAATGLNDRGETARSLREMFTIMEETLPLLREVVDNLKYREVYGALVFDPLNVYFSQDGRDTRNYGVEIADLMRRYLW